MAAMDGVASSQHGGLRGVDFLLGTPGLQAIMSKGNSWPSLRSHIEACLPYCVSLTVTSCGTISNMTLPRCTALIHGACEHDQISFHDHIMLHGTVDLNIENYPHGSGLIPWASKGRETPLADRKTASHRHKQWRARLPDQLKEFKK